MNRVPVFPALLILTASSLSLLGGVEFSKYRDIHLDSSLPEIARQAGAVPEDAKTIHQRPALIQELSRRAGFNNTAREIRFHFYNGQLFRMMVYYDQYRTEGLTEQDIIDATSAVYGTAGRPIEEMDLTTMYGYPESVSVIARWEDSAWSYNLVRFKDAQSFTLAVASKALDGPARLAMEMAIQLDNEEAPQRELDQKRKNELDTAAKLEEARLANRVRFQP